MFVVLSLVIIVISVLIIGIVLIQNPKGGIMSSAFGNMGNSIIGASRSTDVVEKATWYLAAGLMILSVLSVFLLPTSKEIEKEQAGKSEIQEALKNSKSSAAPVIPTGPATSTVPAPVTTTGDAQSEDGE